MHTDKQRHTNTNAHDMACLIYFINNLNQQFSWWWRWQRGGRLAFKCTRGRKLRAEALSLREQKRNHFPIIRTNRIFTQSAHVQSFFNRMQTHGSNQIWVWLIFGNYKVFTARMTCKFVFSDVSNSTLSVFDICFICVSLYCCPDQRGQFNLI